MHMEYNKLRKKIDKFYIGGKIKKLDLGGDLQRILNDPNIDYETWSKAQRLKAGMQVGLGTSFDFNGNPTSVNESEITSFINNYNSNNIENDNFDNGFDEDEYTVNGAADQSVEEDHTKFANDKKLPSKISDVSGKLGGSAAAGLIGGAAVKALGVVDGLTMGDKNFGAQSQAIDSAVHGVSGALMSSGNPYAMIAGAALEGANFLTKAGGQTVQGYDVNIENSGYGTIGHMESSSSRDWGAMIGLGGLFNRGAMERKLAKRNEQARMAMKAAEISEDIKFEQEARMNQVDNVLRNNQIALAGGVDLNLLGA